MKALFLEQTLKLEPGSKPLILRETKKPEIDADEVLIKVHVCGICHTELDEIEGRTPPPKFPVILGHQVVGTIVEKGPAIKNLERQMRVGVAWIYEACGECQFCIDGKENLCREFKATGRDANGGYAEYLKVKGDFCLLIPESLSDPEAAPLLCAGAIGYRSLNLTTIKNGGNLGLTGFGASAHLVLKLAQYLYPDCRIFVFARSPNERKFALELGANWSGDTAEEPPELMDAIIDTTPVWKPIVDSLRFLKPGGRLVINAIRKENIDIEYLLKLDYPEHLWMEKEIKSVANVARSDVREFLNLAAKIPIKPEYQEYPMEKANEALLELKFGNIRGAKVLRIQNSPGEF